jgi:hypothetical protein
VCWLLYFLLEPVVLENSLDGLVLVLEDVSHVVHVLLEALGEVVDLADNRVLVHFLLLPLLPSDDQELVVIALSSLDPLRD